MSVHGSGVEVDAWRRRFEGSLVTRQVCCFFVASHGRASRNLSTRSLTARHEQRGSTSLSRESFSTHRRAALFRVQSKLEFRSDVRRPGCDIGSHPCHA